jgi:uncharacterized membrane protein
MSARSLYGPLGFTKGSSFGLFLFFAGLLTTFALFRFQYLDIDNVYCGRNPEVSVPGECYWTHRGLARVGMLVHLAAFLPAGILVCLQFIPVFQRSKFVAFHRFNGYVVLVLSAVGAVGALIIGKTAVGGTLIFQTGMVVLVTLFVVASVKAYLSIRRLQIDEHRAWMLRAWFYVGASLTLACGITNKTQGRFHHYHAAHAGHHSIAH